MPRTRAVAGRSGYVSPDARCFARTGPDQLWVTDITEHPTREGKVYCCVVRHSSLGMLTQIEFEARNTATVA